MAKEYTVMWVCKVVAESPIDAATVARQTIANAAYSYFDVYNNDGGEPKQVEVPNDSNYMDSIETPYYPLTPKTNN